MKRIVSKCNFDAGKVFIDLGSGVGQVVLAVAALARGCELAIGVEKMENPSSFAATLKDTVLAAYQKLGLRHCQVLLERGDFLETDTVLNNLPRTGILFLNNVRFGSGLNWRIMMDLIPLLPDGAFVVCLEWLKGGRKKMNAKTCNDADMLLSDYDEFECASGDLSWTSNTRTVYIYQKNSRPT